jgi:16S rRNA processing protein RimM
LRKQAASQAPRYLAVGRIGRAHGVRGEVRVEVLTDFPERRYAPGSRLLVAPPPDPTAPGREPEEPVPVVVKSARPHRGAILVRLDRAADRTAAEALTGQQLYVEASDAPELGPDAYYEHQLVGCVVATRDGRRLGRVTELLETGAADVLIVGDEAPGTTVLVPMIAQVIQSVDVDKGLIVIDPLPGLLD